MRVQSRAEDRTPAHPSLPLPKTPPLDIPLVHSIFNQMVKRQPLNRTFHALADPTRRRILERLSRGGARVTELARPHRMSLPAISKHLRVLEAAGLVVRTRVGREHHIHADPKPLQKARDWIALYADVWRQQLNALDAYLAEAQGKHRPKDGKD